MVRLWSELCTVNWCAVRLESLHPPPPCWEVDGNAHFLTRGRSGRKRNREREKKRRLLPRKIEIPISTNVALISTREQVFLLIERIEKLSRLYIKRSDWRPTNKMVWSSQTYNITCSHCFLYFSSCTMLKTEDWVNIHYYNRRTLTDRIYL